MGQNYDKILRNEIGDSLLKVAPHLLGLEIVEAIREPEIQLKLEERVLDSVWRITTLGQEILILHVEFQTKDHPEMNLRMREYHTLLYVKYQLPIVQYVVYLGAQASKMKAKEEEYSIYKGYNLLELREVPYKSLLNHGIPEAAVLSVLCDFGTEPKEIAIQSILENLARSLKYPEAAEKYVYQLIGLGRLCKLGGDVFENFKIMPFEIEDPNEIINEYWLEKRGARAFHIMYKEEGMSIESIARIFSISAQEVMDRLKKYKPA